MHHNSTKVLAPPGGKTSISFSGEQVTSAALKSPEPGKNKCQEARNQSHIFTVGSEGLDRHYNPYQGKRQESSIRFGGDEKVDVRSSIKIQSDAHQSHVFDGPEPTPQPKQANPQPSGGTKQGAASKEQPASVSKQAPVPDKPAPQPAKKSAELQPKAASKPVEEPNPKEHVKTSVQVLAPPGGSSSIVFG